MTAGATAAGDIHLVAVTVGSGIMQGTVTETNSDGSSSALGGVFVILTAANSGGGSPVTDPVPPTAMGSGGLPIILWPISPIGSDFFAYSASDGTYSIAGVPAGTYTATAIRPGFVTQTEAVTITQGQTTTVNFGLTLYQIPTATVTGTVTDASTSAPIAGANVVAIIFGPTPLVAGNGRARPSAVAVPGGPAGFNVTATTDANGNYSLVVPTSTSAIYCFANGYVSAQQSVTVSNGSSSTVNFALTADTNQTATLSGTVTEGITSVPPGVGIVAPAPVAGATVTIETSPLLIPGPTPSAANVPPGGAAPPGGPATVKFTTVTDQSGHYSITIPIGVYEVFATSTDGQSPPSYVRLFESMTEDLTITPGNVPPPAPMAKR